MGSKISFLKKPEFVEVSFPSYLLDIHPRILYFANRFKYPLTYTIKEQDREIAYSIIKSLNKPYKDSVNIIIPYTHYKKIPYLISILKKNPDNQLKFIFADRVMIAEILLLIGHKQKEKYPNMKITNINIKKNKIYPI